MDFIDLKSQYRLLKSQIDDRITTVLEHGVYIMGPEVTELELRLAEFVGVKHAVAVSSGTDALLMALLAVGIKAGDEVITTPFSFIATVEAIAMLGAMPVFVDIDPLTYNIDSTKIEAAITTNTKALLPVSLYGQCADMETINTIAARYRIPVIEDAAQSFGATHHGRRSCALSTVGCTSFYPSKPLGCYGDGGACFTNDVELAERLRVIRDHGQERRYFHTRLGINGRLDTLQAAILLAKLGNFSNEINARNVAAAKYADGFARTGLRPPHISPFNTSVYAQYTIEFPDRDEVAHALNVRGIPTAIHYPLPLYRQPALADLEIGAGNFSVAESAASRVLSLPMHPFLATEEQDYVISEIIAVCGS